MITFDAPSNSVLTDGDARSVSPPAEVPPLIPDLRKVSRGSVMRNGGGEHLNSNPGSDGPDYTRFTRNNAEIYEGQFLSERIGKLVETREKMRGGRGGNIGGKCNV